MFQHTENRLNPTSLTASSSHVTKNTDNIGQSTRLDAGDSLGVTHLKARHDPFERRDCWD